MAWKSDAPDASWSVPGDVDAADLCCACFGVRGLQCFYDTLKVGLLVFIELWLGTYPLSCGSG